MKQITYPSGRRVAIGGTPYKAPRLIRSADLWLAFSDAERNAISGSGAQRAKAFVNTLGIVAELPRADVAQALAQLESAGLITSLRVDAIVNALR